MVPKATHASAWASDTDDDISSSSSEDEAATTVAREALSHGNGQPNGDGASLSKCKSKDKTKRQGSSSWFAFGNESSRARGKVSRRDGRLNLSIKETGGKGYLAKSLGATIQKIAAPKHGEEQPLSPLREEESRSRPALPHAHTASTTALSFYDKTPIPKLNIVIMVIGSRGDIQPFLSLAKILKQVHGHRVRIATHPAFKSFVEKDSGLEFFSVGGDPAEIMAFMVKNPGLIPTAASIKAGEIGRRRQSMYEMFQGFWRACINASDDEKDPENTRMMEDKHPFVADAIIANPVSIAHIHCAERLGIPLHLMFTFPNSPTQQFPHPVTNIKQTNVDPSYTNFISYPLVEMMYVIHSISVFGRRYLLAHYMFQLNAERDCTVKTMLIFLTNRIWQGLGDLINKFRVKTLGLEPASTLWAPGQIFRLKVPYTYLWSPGLVPKPADWGPEVDVVGYVFLDLASSFEPPEGLTKFLDAGAPPVYIGFGSIVVDDADNFTSLIFEAIKKAGVRALVAKGWGNLGDQVDPPDNIYMLGNTPHDWLFPRVSAVVHHGGAGSTAASLKCGRPTLIVPFFGDQPFWGARVAKFGAGPEPIPYKHLTADKLAEGIKACLQPDTLAKAAEIAANIEAEGDGAVNAVKSFHRSLPLRGEHSLRCTILEDKVAVWQLRKTHVRLSALAAQSLVNRKKVTMKDLKLLRHIEWNDFAGPGEPVTGVSGAFVKTTAGVVHALGSTPVKWSQRIKKRDRMAQKIKGQPTRNLDLDYENPQTKPSNTNDKKAEPRKRDRVKRVLTGEDYSEDPLPPANLMSTGLQSEVERLRKTSHTPGIESEPHNLAGVAQENADLTASEASESRENLAHHFASDAGHGLSKAAQTLVKAPMELTLAFSQGLHNAPKLYGDKTVRVPHRITGIQSGLRAAGEEFTFGVYDGITGLVTQPYHGAKKGGAAGCAKGIGMGVGGFLLKDLAAITGPFGYTMKGIHKELIKDKQPTAFITRARIIQGLQDLRALSSADREKAIREVLKGWAVIMNVRSDFEQTRKHGLKGRIALYKEKRKWHRAGAFENVRQAERALEAEREGRDFDEVFQQQMKELRKAERPRKSTVGEGKWKAMEAKGRAGMANGHGGKGDGEVGKANGYAGPDPADGFVRDPEAVIADESMGTETMDKAALGPSARRNST